MSLSWPVSAGAAAAAPRAAEVARVADRTGGAGAVETQLRRAQAGDAGAFRELLHAHQASVYSLALRLLGAREDAQELAQDVFLLLHRHLAAITSAQHLRSWLHRTACHRAIDRLRRRSGRRLLPLDVAELEAQEVLNVDGEQAAAAADPWLERRLTGLVAQLPAVARSVLLLRYQEDLDPSTIARTLGLSLNTVKSHLRRSLARLRRECCDPSREPEVQR